MDRISILDTRFAVGSETGPRSSIWRAWSHQNEIYVVQRSLAGVEKISLHSSRVCRKAFTSEHGLPVGLDDRATIKWKRPPSPDQGLGEASRVLMIAFPTDFLSTSPKQALDKPITWVPAAPSGCATILEMLFTHETEEQVRQEFAATNLRRVVDSVLLPNGELFILASHVSDWKNRQVRVPAGETHPGYLFSYSDPDNTGRPVRIILFNQPNDGDALIGQELGGYRKSVSDFDAADNGIDTLTRKEVFEIKHGRSKLKDI